MTLDRLVRPAVVFLMGATAACSQGPLPDEYLGTWYYTGSSGGFAGDGMGDPATGYIVITADNTIESYDDDGEPVATRTFTVSRDRTIFSAEEQWILDLGSDMAIAEVIQVSDDGQLMSLAENVYDGFQRSYGRSR
jgi:hypothetical protein